MVIAEYIIRGDDMLKNRLKEIRMKDFMMNQNTFANHIGIDKNLYSRYESGKVNPNLESALKISEKLNKNVNDIWTLE